MLYWLVVCRFNSGPKCTWPGATVSCTSIQVNVIGSVYKLHKLNKSLDSCLLRYEHNYYYTTVTGDKYKFAQIVQQNVTNDPSLAQLLSKISMLPVVYRL